MLPHAPAALRPKPHLADYRMVIANRRRIAAKNRLRRRNPSEFCRSKTISGTGDKKKRRPDGQRFINRF
jgi:hypothetical protein